jgi:Rrf2 family protein
MQLTRAADYAVRVMIHLAKTPRSTRVSLPVLAAATGAPESFLSKVLQSLTRAGLVTSQRGPAGGFQVSAPGRQASMREVIEVIDGPMNLNVCTGDDQACPRRLWCPAHPVWVKAQAAVLDVLTEARISDLASANDDRSPSSTKKIHSVSNPRRSPFIERTAPPSFSAK